MGLIGLIGSMNEFTHGLIYTLLPTSSPHLLLSSSDTEADTLNKGKETVCPTPPPPHPSVLNLLFQTNDAREGFRVRACVFRYGATALSWSLGWSRCSSLTVGEGFAQVRRYGVRSKVRLDSGTKLALTVGRA